jgi:hypothetical protein
VRTASTTIGARGVQERVKANMQTCRTENVKRARLI